MNNAAEHPNEKNNDTENNRSPIAKWLETHDHFFLAVYAMVAAFAAYTSMYAFRKPWTAVSYEEYTAFSIGGVTFAYKSIAVIAQVLGYTCSKFLGIKFASEATFRQRVPIVLALLLFAELALILFGMVPQEWTLFCLFLNGLPLGMVWSTLFGILEGRRVTEVLGLGMSVSIIFASDWVKAVGTWVLSQQIFPVTLFWMPAATGLMFIPLLLISLWMLYHLPPPDAEDIKLRTIREPMHKAERWAFIKKHFPGLAFLILAYLVLTVYRGLRDDFMVNILRDKGEDVTENTFAYIGTVVGLIITVLMIPIWLIRNNRAAVDLQFAFIFVGPLLIGLASYLLHQDAISVITFYILNGIGLYLAYIPFQIIWERLIASMHIVATVSFLIGVADAIGYLGTVGLLLTKDIYCHYNNVKLNSSGLLEIMTYAVVAIAPLSTIAAAIYFRKRMKD